MHTSQLSEDILVNPDLWPSRRPDFSSLQEIEGLKVVANLIRTHDLTHAIQTANRLAADLPESAVVRTALGDVRFLARDYSGAERDYRQVVHIRPGDRVAWFMIGRCLSDRYLSAAAADAFKQCLACTAAPDEFAPAAGVWADINQLNAVGDYRPLLEAGPTEWVIVRRHLADALIKADQFAEAVDVLHPAMKAIPADWPMHYQCGVARFLEGRFAEALVHLDEVRRLSPRDFRPAFLAACIYLQRGDHAGALDVCKRGLICHLANIKQRPTPQGPDGATTVALPWNLNAYLFSGLFHPLILGVLDAPLKQHRFEFCGHTDGKSVPDGQILATLNGFLSTLEYLKTTCTEASLGHIFAYLESRHLLSQMLVPKDAKLTVPHTAPYTFLDQPWLLHIETPTTLFYPFVAYGTTRDLDLQECPYFHIVRSFLESPSCVGIFSHLQATCDVVPRLFNSAIVAQKIHYMPLGAPEADAPTEKQFERKCGNLIRGRTTRRILFTSSFNQSDWSFYSRGGAYVLTAFLELAAEFDDIELCFRATIPSALRPAWLDSIVNHPRIQVLHQRLSDAELAKLYVSSDIMALPSYTLHCQTLFRAMYSGAICLISDAPDYSEFIVDRETAVVARRHTDQTYTRDEHGMTREYYPDMREFDVAFAREVTSGLRYILEDRGRADVLRRRARHEIVTRYPRTRMFDEFEAILMRADERAEQFRR